MLKLIVIRKDYCFLKSYDSEKNDFEWISEYEYDLLSLQLNPDLKLDKKSLEIQEILNKTIGPFAYQIIPDLGIRYEIKDKELKALSLKDSELQFSSNLFSYWEPEIENIANFIKDGGWIGYHSGSDLSESINYAGISYVQDKYVYYDNYVWKPLILESFSFVQLLEDIEHYSNAFFARNFNIKTLKKYKKVLH